MKKLFLLLSLICSNLFSQTVIIPYDGQTTTSNSATVISGMSITVSAFTTVSFNGQLHIGCSGTGGVKFANGIPSGATIFMNYSGSTTVSTADFSYRDVAGATLTGTAQGAENSTNRRVHIDGTITTGATGGTIDFEFASGTNGQTSTIYREGSEIFYATTTATVLWSELFNSGYAQWGLTNTGGGAGLTFAVSSGSATWTAAHTSASLLSVADNNIVSDSTYNNDFLELLFHTSWTDAKANNAQFETGFWWDSNNRIYYGNNAADDSAFVRIKISGTNVYSKRFAKNQDYILFMMDRDGDTFSAYSWNSTYWKILVNNISTSSYSIPSSTVYIFNGASDQDTRTGGDAGNFDYYYLFSSRCFPNPL